MIFILNKRDLEELLTIEKALDALEKGFPEDLVVAHRVYQKAIQEGKGQRVKIF